MTQQELDGAHVGTGLQQMDGEGVSQGLLILLMNCTQPGFVIGAIRSMA
jgi:hypothetical protein